MSLAPGARLGVYEVVALIGAGGMGEVYRARDTKLDRDVAIKVLPESFAADPERVARFEREAKTLASLNHPNIGQIYGLEDANPSAGSGQAAVKALVLELVEGPTLADRIARGPIPVDEALPIAKQIAEALEAAHEQGIVHRDLKPANIKVRVDGTVKVLDFGLAKLADPVGAGLQTGPALSQSPTITSPAATKLGVILGTAAYMSPEQAKGRVVDKRADIWAFGCVLYEMLTGRRAFDGADVSDTLAGILRGEPDWSRLPGDVPRGLPAVLRRCLEKDSRARIRDIGDVRLAMEGGFDIPVPTSAAAASTRGWRRERLAWIVAVLLAIAAAAALAVPYVRTPAAAPEMRLDINTPRTSDRTFFDISPDGTRLVFVASGDGEPRLWLRPLDAVTTEPLAGTEGAAHPFWSPDSRSVAFFAGGKLKRVDIGGGPPQTLADAPLGQGGTWSPNGVIVFAPLSGPLFRVPASGGDVAPVTRIDPPRHVTHRVPRFLPDGTRFLFLALGLPDAQGIHVGSLDSPEITRVMAADAAGAYVPPGQTSLASRVTSRLAGAFREGGWLLFLRQGTGTLVARRFDISRGELTGDPVTVADAVGFDAASGLAAFSVSPAGLMAYRADGASRRQLTWYDRTGKALGTLGVPDTSLLHPELSPDGRRVAVDRAVQGNTDLWLLDAVRTIRFTVDASVDHWPIWSPDGSRIAFDSNRTQKGSHDLHQKPSSGAGTVELLFESPQNKGATDWSADGRFILYHSNDPNRGFDVWVLPLEGDRKPQAFLATGFDEGQGQFSPDGRWVAYVSNESGQYQIHVRPFPGPGGQWQISTTGGIQPRWRPDGKELYYIAPDGTLMAAPIAASDATLEPGAPAALFRTRLAQGIGSGVLLRPQYDVARDGRFLMNVTTDDAAGSPITVILNWTAGLNR